MVKHDEDKDEVAAKTCHVEGMEKKSENEEVELDVAMIEEEKNEVGSEEVAMNGEGELDLFVQLLAIEEE